MKIYPDWSQDSDAVGGRLIIERQEGQNLIQLNGGEFSCRLKGAQKRWSACEKECLGIKLLVHHYQAYIRENTNVTTIYTDNIVAVHAWKGIQVGKISTSSRVASFISTMCENNIEILHYPGVQTKVADYNSRHPVKCEQERCQVCRFASDEIDLHKFYIRSINCDDQANLLIERPTWLQLQKDDATLSKLFQLIKQGLLPEKKTKNRSLKLLHNMYRRGLLFIASDGLIQVKNVDIAHNKEYKAILVPEVYVASVIQSLHLKLSHPSPYQLQKHVSRYFFAIGMSKVISNITSACDTCVRLKLLPKQAVKNTTTKNAVFGKNFSADILIEKGQHILVCREKLSQYTTTYLLQDETKESIEEGIVSSLIEFIPDTGATLQVDPGPGLVALANDTRSVLSAFNITLDIGRVHNKNKNPVAENAIKEFRKEWLRFKPDGSSLNDSERARITAIMNKRIRQNGLAPKEMMLKRSLSNHCHLEIDDEAEGDNQLQRRTSANRKQLVKDSVTKQCVVPPKLSVGDLVYVREDLSKSRAREQYIVTKCFEKNGVPWIVARKFNKSLRNKEYLLKASEVVLAPTNEYVTDEQFHDQSGFHGFEQNINLDKRDKIKTLIKDLEQQTVQKRKQGRPPLPSYPDYLKRLPTDVTVSSEDEQFYGFNDQQVKQAEGKKEILLNAIHELDDENQDEKVCHGFDDNDVQTAKSRKAKMDEILKQTNLLLVKLRKLKQRPDACTKNKYAWDYQEWMTILSQDYFEETKPKKTRGQSDQHDRSLSSESTMPVFDQEQDLSYDNSEFFSFRTASVDSEINTMLELDISTIQDFDVHFEHRRNSTSTPTRQKFNSHTDPMLLDKITIVSTSSDSSVEYDVGSAALNEAINEIEWLPSVLDQTVPSGPIRMENILDQVVQEAPELFEPSEGRVYSMDKILDKVEDSQSGQGQQNVPRECPQSTPLRRSTRILSRLMQGSSKQ